MSNEEKFKNIQEHIRTDIIFKTKTILEKEQMKDLIQ